MNMEIEKILDAARAANASDIHIASNEKIAFRINGEISFFPTPIENENISKEAVKIIIERMLSQQNIAFSGKKELDFSYQRSDGTHYRCNAFYCKEMPSLSMRKINDSIPALDEIGTPEKIKELLSKKQGLILISGPAGSGKSTTMASMIDWINMHRTDHIITIEDPIEHHIESKKSFVTQRELHSDTQSFEHSLRAALRQDPNVIAIGEMRDRETIEAVFKLCSTGHLVISTVHAASASQTLYRILSAFPYEQHSIILSQLSDTLLGVLNQRIVPATDNKRLATFEFMIANHAIRNAIRGGDIAQIEHTIATSAQEGMITFDNHLDQLKLMKKIALDFNLQLS